ncbi:MAG: molecular chaperone TorD family protein [Coriobacteriales bacterium]|jgi:TorA maturation chaperone TorD|nr:molecular chaperone TorD family protein [Coriobacteriales bacterium]
MLVKAAAVTHVEGLDFESQAVGYLAARADTFQMLALFLHLPTLELAQGIIDGTLPKDILQLAEETGVDAEQRSQLADCFAAKETDGSDAESLMHTIRTDYTRMFAHPEHPTVSIYESQFLFRQSNSDGEKPRLFTSPAALDAERCYRKAGLKTAGEANEPGDHFGTQLEFAAFLLRKTIALIGGDADKIHANIELFNEFSDLHLHRWISAFFSAVRENAKTVSYRAVGFFGAVFSDAVLNHKQLRL